MSCLSTINAHTTAHPPDPSPVSLSRSTPRPRLSLAFAMTAVPMEVEQAHRQPSATPSSPLSSLGKEPSPPPPLPLHNVDTYRNATASSSGTTSLQPSPPSAGPSTNARASPASQGTSTPSASGSAWGSLAQRPTKPLPQSTAATPAAAAIVSTPKPAARLPPPTPASVPSLPSFKRYAGEDTLVSSPSSPELTIVEKAIAFEHEVPPAVYRALAQTIKDASTPEEGNKAAGDVFENPHRGIAFADAVRATFDVKAEDDAALAAAVGSATAPFDVWLESREFALSDDAGKAAMRARKQPLDVTTLTEVASLLAGLYPTRPPTSGTPHRVEGPPTKKRRKADEEDGEQGGGSWRVVIREKTDDKGECELDRSSSGAHVDAFADFLACLISSRRRPRTWQEGQHPRARRPPIVKK